MDSESDSTVLYHMKDFSGILSDLYHDLLRMNTVFNSYERRFSSFSSTAFLLH